RIECTTHIYNYTNTSRMSPHPPPLPHHLPVSPEHPTSPHCQNNHDRHPPLDSPHSKPLAHRISEVIFSKITPESPRECPLNSHCEHLDSKETGFYMAKGTKLSR